MMGAGPGTVHLVLFRTRFYNLLMGSYCYKTLCFRTDIINGVCGFVSKKGGKRDFEKFCLSVKQIWGWRIPAEG